MIADCFVRQQATFEIISNVTSFCSECYSDIVEDEAIFYDMKNCRYLCRSCQEKLQETLDMNYEPITTDENSLF